MDSSNQKLFSRKHSFQVKKFAEDEFSGLIGHTTILVDHGSSSQKLVIFGGKNCESSKY